MHISERYLSVHRLCLLQINIDWLRLWDYSKNTCDYHELSRIFCLVAQLRVLLTFSLTQAISKDKCLSSSDWVYKITLGMAFKKKIKLNIHLYFMTQFTPNVNLRGRTE